MKPSPESRRIRKLKVTPGCAEISSQAGKDVTCLSGSRARRLLPVRPGLRRDAGHTLVQDLKAALDSLVVHAGGVDPHHRTVWQMNGGTVRPKTEIYETDL